MSYSTETARNDYTGDGATAEYDYTFRITDQTHLLVLLRDDDGNDLGPLAITTDYTVDGVGLSAGGSITLVDNGQAWLDGDGDLLTDYQLTILANVPNKQPTDIRNQGTFYPETHEEVFDRLNRQIQQLQEQIDHCLRTPRSIPTSEFDAQLDEPAAGKFPRVNDAGDGVEWVPLLDSELQVQSGVTDIGNGVSSIQVTFTTAYLTDEISVTFALFNSADSNPIALQGFLSDVSETAFTVTFNATTDTANYKLHWYAIERTQ